MSSDNFILNLFAKSKINLMHAIGFCKGTKGKTSLIVSCFLKEAKF